MMEFHGNYKSIGTEIYRDVTVIWSLWNGRYFFFFAALWYTDVQDASKSP